MGPYRDTAFVPPWEALEAALTRGAWISQPHEATTIYKYEAGHWWVRTNGDWTKADHPRFATGSWKVVR